jgi:threonine synthase
MDWILHCSACDATALPDGFPTVCHQCGQPWLVRYPTRKPHPSERQQDPQASGMWRFRTWLPIAPGEQPITLGEGDTPLLPLIRTGARLGCADLGLKEEGVNPTGSFKARGLSAAITRAVAAGAERFVLPTAGNAGVAAAAYGARAGRTVRVFAPATTPPAILAQIVAFGAELSVLDGHIGDCGKASRAHAVECGAVDLSTLREPYRIEGKKTLALELALQLGWTLPDAIIYPTGGGTGLIGMWKAFAELRESGWVTGPPPRMYSVQSSGCAPVVRAFQTGAHDCEPWPDPRTLAAGLRVPAPLGGRLMLRILRETGGGAVAVDDAAIAAAAIRATRDEGVDFSPEGGAALAAAELLLARGDILPHERVIVFNTGAGWLYREPPELLRA